MSYAITSFVMEIKNIPKTLFKLNHQVRWEVTKLTVDQCLVNRHDLAYLDHRWDA